MRFKLLFIAIFISQIVWAQYKWDFGFQGGVSNYLGDIGGKEKTRRDFVSDMKLAETRWAGALFARYKFGPRLSLKGQFAYQRIQGADSLSTNPARRARNLNFRNDIFELRQYNIIHSTDSISSIRNPLYDLFILIELNNKFPTGCFSNIFSKNSEQ